MHDTFGHSIGICFEVIRRTTTGESLIYFTFKLSVESIWLNDISKVQFYDWPLYLNIDLLKLASRDRFVKKNIDYLD